MAVTSGFYNSLNGDRKYSAEQMSALFDGLINDGVFSNIGTAFGVKATGKDNGITIGVGRAWFNSTWIYNDSILPLILTDSEVLLDRIDAIVIEIDRNEASRSASIKQIIGTASGKPTRPTLANGNNVYQHPLAYVLRRAGSSSIMQADITNMIGTSECPYVTGILEVQSVDNIVAQWQNEFDMWFESLETSLEGDVAVNLVSQILDLQSRFDDLAKNGSVAEALEDSNGGVIRDSTNANVLGTTSLGGSGSSGGDIVIPGAPEEVKEPYKVGDILTTMRTDLDATWLLCNGGRVSKLSYPELAKFYDNSPDGTWQSSKLLDNSYEYSSGIANVVYGDGYFLTAYQDCDNNSKNDIYALYSPNGIDWTSKLLFKNYKKTSEPGYGLTSVAYVNGYYCVLCGCSTGSSRFSLRIYYTADPESGAWLMKEVLSYGNNYNGEFSNYYVRSLIYANGYYIAVGGNELDPIIVNAEGPYLIWSTTLDASSWDARRFNGDFRPEYLTGVAYGNGYYVISGKTDTQLHPAVSYSTYLEGGWSQKELYSEQDYIGRIKFINGYFVVPILTGRIYYASDPTGSWKYKQIDTGVRIEDIIYVDGYYVAYGMKSSPKSIVVYYATSLNGAWTPVTIDTSTAIDNISGIAFGSNMYATTSEYTNYMRIHRFDTNELTLPTISSDRVRAYIKALE